MKTEIRSFFDSVRPVIDATLEKLLPAETVSPSELHGAMRYSVLAGGKRLRPALCIAAYSIYHDNREAILLPRLPQDGTIYNQISERRARSAVH